jgi:hypothetical protein
MPATFRITSADSANIIPCAMSATYTTSFSEKTTPLGRLFMSVTGFGRATSDEVTDKTLSLGRAARHDDAATLARCRVAILL